MNKYITTALAIGTLTVGGVLLAGKEAPILERKPVLDSKIDADIAREQATAISKGEMKSKEVTGTDGVKRTVIPYVSPDGRKGYTVVYEKTEILTDKNGSTTEKVYRQQIDYGHEGRTELW